MKLRLITKQQIAEEKERERKREAIAATRMKFMGRLLQAVRDARDYLRVSEAVHDTVPGVMSYSDLMSELNALLDRDDYYS
jgi:hypothetical protein